VSFPLKKIPLPFFLPRCCFLFVLAPLSGPPFFPLKDTPPLFSSRDMLYKYFFFWGAGLDFLVWTTSSPFPIGSFFPPFWPPPLFQKREWPVLPPLKASLFSPSHFTLDPSCPFYRKEYVPPFPLSFLPDFPKP